MIDDLHDVMQNDNGTTFRRPNWVVAEAELCGREKDDEQDSDEWRMNMQENRRQ